MDTDGNFVVVWSSFGQDGYFHGIYGQRYKATGAMQGSEFQVNTHTTSAQVNAAVAMDEDGDFVVVWESFGQDGPINGGVYGQRYTATGAMQGLEFQVNSYTTNNQVKPSVAMDADGDFVVVWSSYGQDGSGGGMYGQRFDRSGPGIGYEFQINQHTTDKQSGGVVSIDALGDFVVAWQSMGRSGAEYDIYSKLFACCAPEFAAASGTRLMCSITADEIYEADGLIESIQSLDSGDIHYDAGEAIELLPGFAVMGGTTFQAFIDGCPEE